MTWFSQHTNSAAPSSISQAIDFDGEHTPDHPYCTDPGCACHTNVSYHDEVQHPERRSKNDASLYSCFLDPNDDSEELYVAGVELVRDANGNAVYDAFGRQKEIVSYGVRRRR
jgi:hypothetical protein